MLTVMGDLRTSSSGEVPTMSAATNGWNRAGCSSLCSSWCGLSKICYNYVSISHVPDSIVSYRLTSLSIHHTELYLRDSSPP